MLEEIGRGFKDGFHYEVVGIPKDAGSASNVELVSKYRTLHPEEIAKLPAGFDPTATIIPTLEQLRYLFDEPQLI
jgi:hypothetical protein